MLGVGLKSIYGQKGFSRNILSLMADEENQFYAEGLNFDIIFPPRREQLESRPQAETRNRCSMLSK